VIVVLVFVNVMDIKHCRQLVREAAIFANVFYVLSIVLRDAFWLVEGALPFSGAFARVQEMEGMHSPTDPLAFLPAYRNRATKLADSHRVVFID
jgi:hypothetical protein